DILSLDLHDNPHDRSLFIASLNAVMKYLGKTDRTIHCKNNEPILERKFVKLDTKYGVVTVKLGYYKGKLVKATPEYNECKTIAK
ncbi:nickel insertion protein, partial [Clostridioides difficile]